MTSDAVYTTSSNDEEGALDLAHTSPKNTRPSPDMQFPELFQAVQRAQIFEDSKTFVDMIPRTEPAVIMDLYRLERIHDDFDLKAFVLVHFQMPEAHTAFTPDAPWTIDEHITHLWSELARRNRFDKGSLIALPYEYTVPGGRFSEQFYWDGYFIMLGLAAEERWTMVEQMMKNYRHMLRKWGFIPTANRTYFLTRSQPPFFASMVELMAEHKGRRIYIEYLPDLMTEYTWWTKGRAQCKKMPNKSYQRMVRMPNGTYLGRYYDSSMTPRPESLHEDEATALASKREHDHLYLHLRAAAESGWDFSSRWNSVANDISTIHTADIIPIDLNCLLYNLECAIAKGHRAMKNSLLADTYQALADARAEAIQEYCWSDTHQCFMDYNFHTHQQTPHKTLAMMFALYVGIASPEQARAVATMVERDFLKQGGVVTTLVDTGQQWDAPNGWAPLQWVTIMGLRRYGYDNVADTIKHRWLHANQQVFADTRKMIEKYDVTDGHGIGGGGEYPLQDGFGWTNGVYSALQRNKDSTL